MTNQKLVEVFPPTGAGRGGGGEAGGYRESAEAKKENYWLAVTESQVFFLCVLTL